MSIVGGLDVHRAQITFDYLDTDTGEVSTGQIRPATRATLRRWLGERFAGRTDVALAVEGCTGWRFIVEELARAGVEPHLAEPADTATLRGRKKRAKTDRADARLLRELLAQGRLPESWIPPTHVLEVRTLGRTYVALMDERRAWQQRIHAQLFHQGVPPTEGGLLTAAGRAAIASAELSPAGRAALDAALAAIDGLTGLIVPLRARLAAIGRHEPGCRALQAHYGIGPLTAVIIWAELGDPRRFRSSDQAVRFAGLDVTVWSSDGKRSPGRLAARARPTTPTTRASAIAWAASVPRCRSPASSPDAATTRCVRSATRPGSRWSRRPSRRPDDDARCARSPASADVRGSLLQTPCRRRSRRSSRKEWAAAHTAGVHPIGHHVAGSSSTRAPR